MPNCEGGTWGIEDGIEAGDEPGVALGIALCIEPGIALGVPLGIAVPPPKGGGARGAVLIAPADGVCKRRVKSPGPGAGAAAEGVEAGITLGALIALNMRVNSPTCCDGGGAIGFVIGFMGAGV